MTVPRKIAPDRVAIYIRWSTEDQGQGHTLEIQRDSCKFYCMSQGWAFQEHLVFIDEGYSGGSLDRPAITRLREVVTEGLVDCVVVYRLDRLSRNIKDIINLVLGEWEDTCFVRSTQEPVDTTSDAGRMLLTMLGSFADFERASIKTRTFSGKKKNAQKAKNPGIPYAYGYQRGDQTGVFVVDEAEAQVVRIIFQQYVHGLSCRKIAAMLNENGIRSRAGCKWYDADISRMIRNPIYTGKLVYNRRACHLAKKGLKVKDKDPEDIVSAEGAAPPIIDRTTWDTVQSIRESRPRVDRPGGASAAATTSPHLLTGLLRCRCGHSMVGLCSGGSYMYYSCAAYRAGGPAACPCRPIRQSLLDQEVVAQLTELFPLKEPFSPEILAGFQEEVRRQEMVVAALGARERQLDASLERFKADYRAGRLTGEAFSMFVKDVRHEHGQIERQRATEEARLREVANRRLDLDRMRELYDQLDAWQSLEPPERKQILRLLIDRITAYKDPESRQTTLHIEWALPGPGQDVEKAAAGESAAD